VRPDMGHSEGSASFSAVFLALLSSVVGNIGQALWRADQTSVNECSACITEVSILRSEVHFILSVEIVFTVVLLGSVVLCCCSLRPRSVAPSRSAEKSVWPSLLARHPPIVQSVAPVDTTVVDSELSQAQLNEHRRGPRR
jgi:hypothetical protein